LVVCLAIAALGLYLLAYHLNHIVLAIPYLALLACPLMHFMHRGHHGHHHRPTSKTDNAEAGPASGLGASAAAD
jgi:hypothetical protein